jgi:hypothetical protein
VEALSVARGIDPLGYAAAARIAPARPQDHGERVSIGLEGRAAQGRGQTAVADVRWYRAGLVRPGRAARDASLVVASETPTPAPSRPAGRPVHSGVKAYQRVLASPRE